ncbi:hypothetical protein [Acidiphilium sp.]|uniref:hypothetical protein n=1 Tax=Acidiphilium sp. TaxID=527 RepID=UPI0025851985|nr:hypothetical protein [Acidiphilium sp.]
MDQPQFPDPRDADIWIERHGRDGLATFRIPRSGRRLQGMTARMVEVLCHPASSDWLKRSIITAVARDALDAARDATHLAELLDERFERVVGSHPGRAVDVSRKQEG